MRKAGTEWVLEGVDHSPTGHYSIEEAQGQGTGDLRVEIQLADGTSRTLWFEDSVDVEYPPTESLPGGYVQVPRETLTFVVDEQTGSGVVGIDVQKITP